MGYSDIPDAYMSRILAYAFVFFSTRTTILLQDIMVSPRPFTRFASTTTGLDSRPTSKTTASCATICSHTKPMHHRPYRLLKQLPIPERPWNSISMDFIEKLPKSSSYMSILVVVDHLSKQSLFIPTYDMITS